MPFSVPLRSVSFSGVGGSSSTNTGAIVGAVVGGIAGLGVIGALIFFFYRRRRQSQKGIYNRTERIESVKPSNYPSDSVLEPLSSTLYPGMHDMRAVPYPLHSNASGTLHGNGSSANMSSYPATPGPFHVRNLADAEMNGAPEVDDSSAVGGSSTSGNPRPMPPTPGSRGKNAEHNDELRSEVDNLRREIERIREERAVLSEPPPSYDEDVVGALRAPGGR